MPRVYSRIMLPFAFGAVDVNAITQLLHESFKRILGEIHFPCKRCRCFAYNGVPLSLRSSVDGQGSQTAW